jgi:flagellar FliJ protein
VAKFVFHLEAVLRQRETVEKQARRELAARLRNLESLKAELAHLDQSLREATEHLRANHLTGPLDMSYIQAHRRFAGSVQRQGMQLAQKIALAQREFEAARMSLAEAAKARKIMEKLRERQWQRWKAQLDARDARESDEIGMKLAYEMEREG